MIPGEGADTLYRAFAMTRQEDSPSAVATPAERPPALVAEPRQLAELCRRWRRCGAIAVDTEFVRERTYYPALGLIQMSDGDAEVLIDPLALDDLEELRGLFADQRVTKVLHSCSEDMEVLYLRFGELPRPVFDTQIAAALAGLGYSLGYGSLVEALFGAELPKQATRTNWLKRPLSREQREYAALDVAYLLPIYHRLRDRLRQTGREAWAEEEFRQLQDTGRFESEPEDAYRRFRRTRGLDRRQRAALRALAVWREREARRRDLPRNFVLREAALPELARRLPRSLEELRGIRDLGAEDRRRHGRALLGLIREALALPEEELPRPAPRPIDLSPHRRAVDRLREAVAEVARELDLPPELLATRRTVESLARRVIAGRESPLPEELRGWRREVVGERLLDVAAPLAGASQAGEGVRQDL